MSKEDKKYYVKIEGLMVVIFKVRHCLGASKPSVFTHVMHTRNETETGLLITKHT